MSTSLQLVVTRHREAFTISVCGEVDLFAADQLVATARRVLDSDHCGLIILDLGEVSFIDCSGLRALLTVRSDATKRSTGFGLRRCPPDVRRLAEITGVDVELTSITSR